MRGELCRKFTTDHSPSSARTSVRRRGRWEWILSQTAAQHLVSLVILKRLRGGVAKDAVGRFGDVT
jgi:hypothetical protein